jgi:TRAP-type C4-dicarboxylate transport system permease small subunit
MRAPFLKVYRAYGRLLHGTAVVGGITTFLMMWVIDANVILRKLFNWPLPAGVEFSQSLLTISIILPFAYTQLRRDHVRTTLLVAHFPERLARILHIISIIGGAVLFACLTYAAYRYAMRSYRMNEMVWGAAIRFPLYPAKMAVSLGALLIAIQFLLDAILLSFFPEDDGATAVPEAVEGQVHV